VAAGLLPVDRTNPEREAVLAADGSALDAVTATLRGLADAPLSSDGRGAPSTREGRRERDAAVILGRDRRAGRVAGVFGPRDPGAADAPRGGAFGRVLMIGAGALRLGRARSGGVRRDGRRLDAAEHGEAPGADGRKAGSDGPTSPPDRKAVFDALANRETGRHLVVGVERRHARSARHAAARLAPLRVEEGPLHATRFGCLRVARRRGRSTGLTPRSPPTGLLDPDRDAAP